MIRLLQQQRGGKTTLHCQCHYPEMADLSAFGSLSEDDIDNGHQDQEEVKLVPAAAPVVVPAEPCDFDSSFNDEDSCEGIIAVLFGL